MSINTAKLIVEDWQYALEREQLLLPVVEFEFWAQVHPVFPPIPIRKWDWNAYLEGYEEDGGVNGWGNTPFGALWALAIEIDDQLGD